MKQYFQANSKSNSRTVAVSVKTKLAATICLSAALGLALTTAAQRKSVGHSQSSQSPSSDSGTTQKGAPVTQAKGTFEVKLDPQGEADKDRKSTRLNSSH